MGGFFIALLNLLIKGFGSVLLLLVSFLPGSPFKVLDNSPVGEYLGGINYFVPVAQILDIAAAWLVAIGIFYIYQIVLRWVKAVE